MSYQVQSHITQGFELSADVQYMYSFFTEPFEQ